MASTPSFDVDAAHRYFAADCFNKAWELMESPRRTAEEDRLLVALNQASLYHWLQRPDCDNTALSVGYWQASRIQALLGNAGEALRHAEACRSVSAGLEPFYQGYACEALARAARLSGDSDTAAEFLAQAEAHAAQVVRDDDRALLFKDLTALR
jgi:hypothetical protein